jgi:hypothetical protein
MEFTKMADDYIQELLLQYDNSDDHELSEASELLWDLVISQGDVGPDAPVILEHFLSRLRTQVRMYERFHTLMGLESVLQSFHSYDEELKKEVIETSLKYADVIEMALVSECMQSEAIEEYCDIHEVAVNVSILLGISDIGIALLTILRRDYWTHRGLWPAVETLDLWPQLSNSELEQCYKDAPYSVGWVAVCILLTRGAEAGTKLLSDMLKETDPFFSPTRECALQILRSPEALNLVHLRELFRRASEPVVLEFLACSILRVVSGDQREGWNTIIEESSLPRLKIRHPEVRSIHPSEVSSSVVQEAKSLLVKSRMQIVDTDLWALFGVS